jgi:hypothetical protein
MKAKQTTVAAKPAKPKRLTKADVMQQAMEKAEKGELILPPQPAPKPDPLAHFTGRTLEGVTLDEVCDAIAGGQSVRHIATALKCSPSGVLKWIDKQPEGREHYARAKAEMAEFYASELMAIANEPVPVSIFGTLDSGAVQDKRLRVDTVKWISSKLLPKVYGDKLDLTSGGDRLANLSDEQLDARLIALLNKVRTSGGLEHADPAGEAGAPAGTGSEG